MKSHTQAILQSARIAEFKAAASLVKPAPRVELPRDAIFEKRPFLVLFSF
jgi:hypothetical protein